MRIVASGICHTDLLIRDGTFPTPMPVVLGHEGAGVVEEVGAAVTRVKVGDHVASTYASCGGCRLCAGGHPFHCTEFFERNFLAARADGSTAISRGGEPVHSHFFGQSSFATGAVIPERSVVAIPDDVPFEVVAPFGCGIQTGAGAVMNVLRPLPNSSIAIFGAGGVGLSAVMAAAIAGCSPIIAVDVRPGRLALAQELGATHAVDAAEVDPVEAIGELVPRRRRGQPRDQRRARRAAPVRRRPRPRRDLRADRRPAAGHRGAASTSTACSRVGRGIKGIVEGHSVPQVFIPKLIELWRAGRLPVDRLVRAYDFDQINQAADDALAGEVVKPVLRMG